MKLEDQVKDSLLQHLDDFLENNSKGEIINISSQSVYGQSCLPPWNEEKTKAAPNTPYSSAKYSTEIMLNEISHQHKQIRATSLRLSGIIGGAKGLVNIDLVSKFVENVQKSTFPKFNKYHFSIPVLLNLNPVFL